MVLQSEDEEKLGYEGFPIDYTTLYDIYTKSLHQAHMQYPWIHSRQLVMKYWTPCKILKPNLCLKASAIIYNNRVSAAPWHTHTRIYVHSGHMK
jgi:hypothetical protein